MVEVEVRHPVAPADVAVLRDLAERAAAADDRLAFDDSVWRELTDPGARTAIVLALESGRPVAAAVLSPAEGSDRDRFNVELVTAAADPQRAVTLLEAAAAHIRAAGGRRLQLWVLAADPADDRVAAGAGLAPERELWQMRVALPLAEEPRWPGGVRVGSFRPGVDEAAWLVANNRTFAADPDQGGWTDTELRRREDEPWFDPAGFLVARDDHGIAGFCWTKIHPAAPPGEPDPLGEIYVIGVDPDRRGIGLGRALTVGGLASLHGRGTPVGMLYVDASNGPAVGLYRALGFTVSRVDRAYLRSVA